MDRFRTERLDKTAEILFVSDRDTGSRRTELYTMDAKGGNVHRLTYSPYHHFISGVDRSRRYVVTSRAERDTTPPEGLGDEDRRAVWVLDLETKEETRITDPDLHAESKSFSPDGEWITFLMKSSVPRQGQAELFKVRRDGTQLTRLTKGTARGQGDPQWSHDGTEIAYCYLDPDLQRLVIKGMDAAGEHVRTICDLGPGPGSAYFPPGCFDPTWSPDDEWLVFERPVRSEGNDGHGVWHIFKVRRDGTEATDLTEAGGHPDWAAYLPSFSPDGKYVVFGVIHNPEGAAAHRPDGFGHYLGQVDVYRMDSDGGNLTRLTEGAAHDMYPVWIPGQ